MRKLPAGVKTIALILFVTLLPAWVSSGYSQMGKHVQPRNVPDCRQCHTCPNPTPGNPCLRECPRPLETKGEPMSSASSPDIVVLGQLQELYVPVVFSHKLHAEMSEIAGGCTLCHHYTPTKQSHPPCEECHDPGPTEGDLRKPGLKGAFHRQCMSCHREWSHDTECALCHLKKAGGALAPTVEDQSDILGVPHPIIHEPETMVYETGYEKGPVVTFHHEEHIQRFDLSCVDCHREENCSRCHDTGKRTTVVKTFKEHHQPCYSCHEGAKCIHCHDTVRKPLFTHSQVGWPHNRFHKDLNCRSCHPTGRKILKLDRECTSCHMNWYQGKFEHQVTGVRLGEIHFEFDCENCHIDRRFDVKPTCENCHDEDQKYSGAAIP